jgi:outer membrane protein OmpA-like peptidoglycan-associated protein/Tol biopolymer transport system component
MKTLRYSAIAIVTFLISQSLVAQSGKDEFMAGMKFQNRGEFELAINKFKDATGINPNFQDAWYQMGFTANYIQKPLDAIYAFDKLYRLNPNYNDVMYYEMCKAFIVLNRLDEAKMAAQEYLNRIPKSSTSTMTEHLGKNRFIYAEQSPEIRSQQVEMTEPAQLAQINSGSGDYMPQVNPTGDQLYFTSVRQGGFDDPDENNPSDFGEDLYVARKSERGWNAPELLPEPLNSMGDDFGSAFTGDGQTMVYVRCGDPTSVGNCDLYITQLDGTQWSEPINMGNVVNSEEWDSQPTINSDGNRIIFASARAGGYGGIDLYSTTKNYLGDWGIPVNMGSNVNTPLNDTSPYLAPDGKTLYYSTDGHPGYGGMDIFYTIFESDKWAKPVNVGAPLNSSGDDTNFSISAAGDGYFASSRLDPANYDIFQVELPDHLKPKPTAVVQGLVSNSKSAEPIGAVVLIEDLNTGELLAVNKSNSATGEYLVVLPAGRDYSVSANSDGYFFYSTSFELPGDTSYQEITMDIQLEPIEKGTKVVLNNIFFESGRAELKPISYVELNKAYDLLENNPTMIVEIGGHTDNVGSESLNLSLSEKRAKAVMDYLVLAGIDASRIQSKGYGESVPIADNTTEEGKAANRRTEFTILEF